MHTNLVPTFKNIAIAIPFQLFNFMYNIIILIKLYENLPKHGSLTLLLNPLLHKHNDEIIVCWNI